MNVTQNPMTPALKQGHAHLLCVGEPEDDAARAASAVREDELGTWSLHETALEALERGIQLLREEPSRRVVLDLGDCLCVSERRWTGPALRRLERVSPRVPRGALTMTAAFKELVSEHIEEAEDLKPLRTPDMTGEATELMVYQAAHEESVFARSNLSFERRIVLGRAAALEQLAALEDRARVVELTGVAGVGKSALAYRYACVRALADATRERWWLDTEGVEEVEGLANALAMLFGVRLGPDPDGWSDQFTAMMSHRPLSCTMHMDGLDQLGAQARAWLEALIARSEGTRWVLAHREAWGGEDAATLEVEALEEEDGLALLMTDSEGIRGVQELERARTLWRGCAGRPLALLHAKHHAHGLGAVTAEELSASRRAERDWASIDARSRALISALLELEGGAEIALLELMFAGELDPDTLRASLARLRTIGWAHLDPTRDTQTWRVPEVFAGFVRANLTAEERARAEERASEGILSFASTRIADLRGPRERAAIAILRRHERDIMRALERSFARDRARCVEVISSLRAYMRIAFSTFELKPLVERLLTREDLSSAHAVELEVTLALASSYDTKTSVASGELLDRCIARADELDASSLFEVYLQRAIELEDTFTTPEELARAVGLVELALAQVTGPGGEAKRASCEEMWARLEAQRGAHDAALAHAERARDLATRSGSDSSLGLCLFTLHRQHVARGQLQQAERTCEQALRAMERAGHVTGEIMVLASSGYLDGMLGRARRGKARLHRALRHSRANSYTFGVMNCEYLLGLMYLTTQSWEDAIAHLQRARTMHIEFEFAWNQRQCEVALAIALAARGEAARARALVEGAATFFAEHPYGPIHYMIALAERAPAIWEAGWVTHDLDTLDALERELEGITPPDDAPRGLDLGVMLGLIASARSESASEPAPTLALRVARDASSFTIPGADAPVDMSRRRTVRRVLEALVTERVERPGEVLDAHTLMSRGWPGESTEVRNALMKLYVTINTLRRLGLEDILQTYGEGYRLDPEVPIALEAEDS